MRRRKGRHTSDAIRGRLAPTDSPNAPRYAALRALQDEASRRMLRVHWAGLRDGPYLVLATVGSPSVRVRCDYLRDQDGGDGGWWYVWHLGDQDGRTIAPVDDMANTLDVIRRELHRAVM
ncbi:hypothetical protein [Actinomadura gamaensis]|uniref:DUF3024 domain-containing protein n=1 Tax=Actinomadura gamaensis TaxID=1763541 RepID=A0ABV9U6Z5_9ACTN